MCAEPEAAEIEIVDPPDAGPPAQDDAVFRFRQDIISGEHWFVALVDAVGRWRLPAEVYDGRRFSFLIAGEAFDWLVLAERLLEEVEDLVPETEAEALVFDGVWPVDMDDDEFAERIGQAKHRAHLNYLYGVLVEEALLLSVEEEIHKENFHRPWGANGEYHEAAFQRIYGRPCSELLDEFRDLTGTEIRGRCDYQAWKAFTYFRFRQRIKGQDPARVASDTRKGLAQLSRMELAVGERRDRKRGRRVARTAAKAAGI
ncbi:MAG: hypothetical protein ACE5EF_13875 [Dehalococcoidia bacterium]